MMEQQIIARIADLERERDTFVRETNKQVETFVAEANKQVFGFNASIAELRKLIAPADAPIPAGSVADPGEEQTDGAGRDGEAEVVHQDDVAGLGQGRRRDRATTRQDDAGRATEEPGAAVVNGR
jgi:hypothetical protein